MTTEPQAIRLETEACSRCGGSGQYSYCQMHGTRCFKCGGKGSVLTPRGKAANAYLRELRSKRADALQPGDVFFLDGCGVFADLWVTVISSGQDPLNPQHFTIVGDKTSYSVLDSATMLRVRHSKEEAARLLQMAIDYQDTLTKTGKPKAKRTRQKATA